MMRSIHGENAAAMGSVSIGVSLYPRDGRRLNELYPRADEALYKAKRMGKNQAALTSELT